MKYVVALLSLAAATAAVDADCVSYCQTITAACTDTFAQYQDEGQCLNVCEFFEVSVVGSTGDNTLGCRQYHAEVALNTTAPNPHCAHAGPSGGNQCGTGCEAYSSLAGICTSIDGADSNVDAPNVCDDIPTGAITTYTSDAPEATDTLMCRIYHWTVAVNSTVLMETHCPHGAVGTDATHCGTSVTSYCRMMDTACPDSFASPSACAAAVNGLDLGELDDQAGDTLYCRIYHAGAAMESLAKAAIHCPHANGTTLCVADGSTSDSDSDDSSDAASLVASGLALVAAVLAL